MRRADERERELGERGGKRDWKVFRTRGRCGGVVGDGGGKEARTSCLSRIKDISTIFLIESNKKNGTLFQGGRKKEKRTKGGLRYSTILTLLLLLMEFCTSFTRLYLSILKLSVGPFDSLTILSDGATSVSVNASRCVTWSAGAIVKKSFSLFRARSFTCEKN